jgi:Bardet-Biedl syndrome 5 protein
LRKGEILVDSINSVEDTKGNNGDKGNLLITNLRLVWFDDTNQKINLSIGFDCILNIEIKITNSILKGSTQALYLRTRFNQSRFEFIFTSLVKNSPRLFTSFQAVVRSYETTKLYRDLKLRAAIVSDKTLNLLPKEQIYNKYQGVWNLSAEQGNLGTFFVTNVRIVWFANLAENFNVSVPWIQISTIKVRETKFGTALVIETSSANGGYILGFKLEQIEKIYMEITGLFKVYSDNPIFGIETTFEDAVNNIEEVQRFFVNYFRLHFLEHKMM